MSTERDELADELADSIFRYTGVTTSSSKSMADELLAAGYRKPQQVTTIEELDELPDWSVIRGGEVVFTKSREGHVCWATLESGFAGSSKWFIQVHGPATVLHVGGAA